MTIPQLVRHAVARRHVGKREDYLVQGYLRLLRKDDETLRDELNGLKPVGFSPSGRFCIRACGCGFVARVCADGWSTLVDVLQ